MISFRQAKIEDLPRILEIISSNFIGAKREDTENLTPYIDTFGKIQSSPDNYLFAMLKDGVIIGTFHVTIIPSLAHGGSVRSNIESVHIAPEMRGTGYGTQMMQYAIEFSKQKGAKLVQLATDKKRTEAKKFYEKLGFVASHEGMKMKI